MTVLVKFTVLCGWQGKESPGGEQRCQAGPGLGSH